MVTHSCIPYPPAGVPRTGLGRVLPRSDQRGSRDREYCAVVPRLPLHRRILRRPAVIMVLHGCRQDAAEIMSASRFAETADASDAVIVFPSVTSWAAMPPREASCWGFWIEAERRRDEGEIGDLRRILAAVEAEFGTDPARRYVAGLSSGGAMAVAMAVVYGDAIRAAGSVAGIAFGETTAAVAPGATLPSLCPWFLGEARPRLRRLDALVRDMAATQNHAGCHGPVPLLILQSTRDRVVRIENARMLRDVWIARYGVGTASVERLSPPDSLVAHDRYCFRSGGLSSRLLGAAWLLGASGVRGTRE